MGGVEKAPAAEIGRQIYEARIEAGIRTSHEAARKVEMAQSNYWRLEKLQQQPSWATVHRVITRLGLPLERFFPAQMILAAAHRIVGRQQGVAQ